MSETKKKPRMPDIRNAELQEMVEKVRQQAWFRQGKHATVERLRKDKGFATSVVEHALNILASGRAHLFRDALNAAIRNRPTLETRMREGLGVWWDEMERLAPVERAEVLRLLRKQWDVPERPTLQ